MLDTEKTIAQKRNDERIRCLKCTVWLDEKCSLYAKKFLDPGGSLLEAMSWNKRSFLIIRFQFLQIVLSFALFCFMNRHWYVGYL